MIEIGIEGGDVRYVVGGNSECLHIFQFLSLLDNILASGIAIRIKSIFVGRGWGRGGSVVIRILVHMHNVPQVMNFHERVVAHSILTQDGGKAGHYDRA